MLDNNIESLKELTEAASATKLLSDRDFDVVAKPKEYELVRLEQFKPEPDFFRAHFKTSNLLEFTAYTNKNATEHTQVFIEPAESQAITILDMGSPSYPEWGKHRASVTLKKTPAYAALLEFSNAEVGQQDVIDFFEDWFDHINFYDGEGEPADFRKTINALRKVKVSATANAEQTVGNFAGERSLLETVEVKSGNDRLPVSFTFSAEPYDDFGTTVFNCQLRAIINEKSVKFKYRINSLPAIVDDIGRKFRELIKGGIDNQDVAIYLGTIAYQS